MKIIFLESKKWSTLEQEGLKRNEVEKIVKKAVKEAVKLLPPLSPHLNLISSPIKSGYAIPETATKGATYSEENIDVDFDCSAPHGVDDLKRQIRSMVLHELAHGASYFGSQEEYSPDPMRAAKEEGIASTFEKLNTETMPPWAKYEKEEIMMKWYKEIKALPNEYAPDYLFDHPDGRKWIIYKTGVWAIEKMLAAGFDLNELIVMPYKRLFKEFDKLLKTNPS